MRAKPKSISVAAFILNKRNLYQAHKGNLVGFIMGFAQIDNEREMTYALEL